MRLHGTFVGLATLDLGYLAGCYPAEDTKSLAEAQFMAAGGPATNAAVTFSFLAGGGSQLVTGVGTHPLAGVVRDDLRDHGVRLVDLARERTEPPPVSSITVSRATGSRTVVSLDASRLMVPAPRRPEALLDDAMIVLVDGHLMDLCVSVARAARATGVPVVFDGGRWKSGSHELCRHVDIAICPRSFHPPGVVGRDGVHRYLHDAGVAMAVTTDGAGPVRFSTPTSQGELAVGRTTVIDTLGAGDIFHGAFCYYFLSTNNRFCESLQHASTVASASCAHFGTRAWMRTARSHFPA
ncbi:MAG: PfkB family carbohydrate kinase [Egibacteraceae bacterium]